MEIERQAVGFWQTEHVVDWFTVNGPTLPVVRVRFTTYSLDRE